MEDFSKTTLMCILRMYIFYIQTLKNELYRVLISHDCSDKGSIALKIWNQTKNLNYIKGMMLHLPNSNFLIQIILPKNNKETSPRTSKR